MPRRTGRLVHVHVDQMCPSIFLYLQVILVKKKQQKTESRNNMADVS